MHSFFSIIHLKYQLCDSHYLCTGDIKICGTQSLTSGDAVIMEEEDMHRICYWMLKVGWAHGGGGKNLTRKSLRQTCR